MLNAPPSHPAVSGSLPREAPLCSLCGRRLPVPWPSRRVFCCDAGHEIGAARPGAPLSLVLPVRHATPSEAKRSFLLHLGDRITSARVEPRVRTEEPFGGAVSSGLQASLDRMLPARLRPGSDLPEAQATFAAREAVKTLDETYTVSAFDTLFAPYWYIRGRLWEAIRGRIGSGNWALSTSICDMEVSRPAFPASLPLPQAAANLAPDGNVLPGEWLGFWPEGLWIPPSLQAEGAIAGLADVRLDEKVEAVSRKAFFYIRNALLVFRPFGLMTLSSKDDSIEIIMDLFSGMPSGVVTATEMEGLVKAADRSSPIEPEARAMKTIALSCPKCRIDFSHRLAGEVFLCPSCGHVYEHEESGWRVSGWEPGPWVPASPARAFWRGPTGTLLPADTGRKRAIDLHDGGSGDLTRKRELLNHLKRPVRVARLEAARAFEMIDAVASKTGGTAVDPAVLTIVLASEDALLAYSRSG
ncbi:MAG: hypothetical protein L6R30_20655 [Thermoanaerobaculia bacterium]|nr:hypothetical protein [Thermoanaerobaculia bacterium]